MVITNARVVQSDDVFVGSMHVVGDLIASVDASLSATPAAEDWEGDYLIPGLVELHTDNLEKHLTPRPGVRWPAMPAVMAHDAQIVAAGITTVLDAVAIGDLKESSSRIEQLRPTLDAIRSGLGESLLRADHHLHLRCELSYSALTELFESLLAQVTPRLVSVMDHTPGQRQFVDIAKYRQYYQGKHGMNDTEMDAFTERQIKNQRQYSTQNRAAVVEMCRDRAIPLASHDDATTDHIDEAVREGMTICEFPTTSEAANAARANGLGVLMGAPNLVRGGSHSGNVSALELAQSNLLNGFSSDYVPVSLLHAAFLLRDRAGWTLPKAVASVSKNPAEMVKLDDRGEIAPGKRADFLRVRENNGVPLVLGVWREGQRIL